MLIPLSLFTGEGKEACAIQTMCCWVEIVAKELKEFRQVLAKRRDMINAKLL